MESVKAMCQNHRAGALGETCRSTRLQEQGVLGEVRRGAKPGTTSSGGRYRCQTEYRMSVKPVFQSKLLV